MRSDQANDIGEAGTQVAGRPTALTSCIRQPCVTASVSANPVAKLVGHGFVEISTANGQDAIAKVTRAGAHVNASGLLGMMALVALISIAMIGYLYGCDVSDD